MRIGVADYKHKPIYINDVFMFSTRYKFSQIPDSAMLSIAACHPVDLGSNTIFKKNLQQNWLNKFSGKHAYFVSLWVFSLKHVFNSFCTTVQSVHF